MRQNLFLVKFFFLLLLCGFIVCYGQTCFAKTRFAIVMASYNNKDYTRWSLESALRQNYDNFYIVFVDDNSDDITFDIAKQVVAEFSAQSKVHLIKNRTRKRQLANQYHAIHNFVADEDVVVILDGDDALWGTDVLQKLDNFYSENQNLWLTYGQYRRLKWGQLGICKPIPEHIIKTNIFRQFDWVAAHLRTFKAWLFKKIKKTDLMFNGKFVPSSADKAAMFPMLEMASNGHFTYISNILLIHNDRNPLNCYKSFSNCDAVHSSVERKKVETYIRKLRVYKSL